MKRTILPILTAALLAGLSSTHAESLIRITEAMTNGDIADWFEIRNFGSSTYSLLNHRMDDNSFNIANSVALTGIDDIAAGETVVFIEGTSTTADTFRTNWGLDSSVKIGFYSGSGVGFSSSGDGLTLYSNASPTGTELAGPNSNLIRVSFGAATSGTSLFWSYDAAGANLANGLTAQNSPSAYYGDVTTWQNGVTAMVGTPGSVPEPSSSALLGLGTMALLALRRLNRKA
jgi:hypothetical protein